MRFLRRSLIGVVLLSLTAGILAAAAHQIYAALRSVWDAEAPTAAAAERVFSTNVVRVEPGTVVPVLQTFGEVRSRRTLELRASAGGAVVSLAPGFEEGGAVRAGETLVRIDPTDAEAALALARADLAEAEAERRDAERGLALARDDRASAEAQDALRQRAFERQRDLAGRGVGTEAAVETAELAAAAASQAVLTRRGALAEAERRRDETEIRAGFDGVLTAVSAVEGGLVTVNEQLAQLVDPAALEVAFRLSTAQYARLLGPGGVLREVLVEASLDADGIDLRAAGRVGRAGAVVEAGQTGRLVFARLDAAPGFRPGDFVTVRLEEPPLDGVAVLPAAALGPEGSVLALGPEDRLEAVPAALLRRQGDTVIVRADALAGREVVAERSPFLGPGIRVRPLRPADAGDAPALAAAAEGEMLELSDERRARLVAFVEAGAMPEPAKARVLAQLRAPQVPAGVVARIEERMGG